MVAAEVAAEAVPRLLEVAAVALAACAPGQSIGEMDHIRSQSARAALAALPPLPGRTEVIPFSIPSPLRAAVVAAFGLLRAVLAALVAEQTMRAPALEPAARVTMVERAAAPEILASAAAVERGRQVLTARRRLAARADREQQAA